MIDARICSEAVCVLLQVAFAEDGAVFRRTEKCWQPVVRDAYLMTRG